MSTAWTIVLIVLCVIAAVMVVLYFVGPRCRGVRLSSRLSWISRK